MTDEWSATKNIRFRLEPMGLKHHIIRHKKKTGGGFARWVKIEPTGTSRGCRGDGITHLDPRRCIEPTGCGWLQVHTNKCEGLNAHLKAKLKRIKGSRLKYIDGYIREAVWRQNSRARKESLFVSLVRLFSVNKEPTG
jgi:hypothetical protein